MTKAEYIDEILYLYYELGYFEDEIAWWLDLSIGYVNGVLDGVNYY